MNFNKTKILVASALVAASGLAQAATITFDSLTTAEEYRYTDDTYVEAGFAFASTMDVHAYSLFTWGTTSLYDADATGATLSQNADDFALKVTRQGGGIFTLQSFDLADGDNVGGGFVVMDYTNATGHHEQLLTLDATPGLQTFTFGYTGVTSFSLGKNSPYYQLDNVDVDAVGPSVSVVPEPETLSLMFGGLLLLAGIARRRKL